MLNSYFTGVSTVDDGILPHFARRVDDNVFSNHVDFTVSDSNKRKAPTPLTRKGLVTLL